MIHYARIISCYAADTSGVCSALFELGGMVVVHDASGCNSTYSTHDEPRWYDMDSMIYISGLTEIDAVMGNDEKFISDVCKAAEDLHPAFIAICGSPMPAMTGTDFDAIADIIEQRCNIPTFAMNTNGMHSYLDGASQAFSMLAENFCEKTECEKSDKIKLNIIGATPLDFSRQEIVDDIKKWAYESGFEICCTMAMGDTLENIRNAGNADCSLVISYSGFEAAKILERRFGIPYVVGVPFGEKFSRLLKDEILKANNEKCNILSAAKHLCDENCKTVIVGESVYSTSLARALELDFGRNSRVICTLDTQKDLLCENDLCAADECVLAQIFQGCETVIADPLFKPIVPENVKFIGLPHEAFSGRCFRKDIPNLINKKLGDKFER